MPTPDKINSTAFDLMRYRMRETERHLITAIERIEGRVPTDEEAVLHGMRAIHPDGREEWKWRGKTILVVHPPRWAENGSLLIDFQMFTPA